MITSKEEYENLPTRKKAEIIERIQLTYCSKCRDKCREYHKAEKLDSSVSQQFATMCTGAHDIGSR